MSEAHPSENPASGMSREDELSALFGQLVLRQANMAAMLLGQIAHPESGQTVKDVEAARLFIDELEMLDAKTRGNLSKEEAAFLKHTLMNLRLAFVQAVESPSAPTEAPKPAAEPAKPEAAPAKDAPAPGAAAGGEEEHRKKFSKKY